MRGLPAVGISLVLSACAANAADGDPITIARHAFGGEALYNGILKLRRGCIVTGGDRPATVLFDPDVTLTDDRTAVRDGPDGVLVPFGVTVFAGSAVLREAGAGWSLAEIEEFFGVDIPDVCPTDEVVRLHGFKTDQ